MKNYNFLASALLLITCCMLSTTSFAQVPQAFKYQSIIRNVAGNPMANEAVGIRVAIHNGASSGPIVYQETHTVTTNQFGLINLEIGRGITGTGTFQSINWASGTMWIEIEANFGNGYLPMG